MNGESQLEVFLSLLVLGLATAFATGYIRLPQELVRSPILNMFLVIIALVSFSVFPMAGLALFFLLAVLLFSRNVETTLSKGDFSSRNEGPRLEIYNPFNSPSLAPMSDSYSATVNTHPVTERPEVLNTGNTTYGERSIMGQSIPVANPYYTFKSDHRSFNEFNETDQKNPVLGKIVENFEPANINEEQGAPVEGQYPKEQPRALSRPDSRDFTFRPMGDMGSNDFAPVDGVNIDEKLSALKY